jgi:hypothetical protein
MPDEIDLANEQAERFLEEARAAAAISAPLLPPKGSCYYCETPFPEGDKRKFCDGDCASDYAQEEKLKNRR